MKMSQKIIYKYTSNTKITVAYILEKYVTWHNRNIYIFSALIAIVLWLSINYKGISLFIFTGFLWIFIQSSESIFLKTSILINISHTLKSKCAYYHCHIVFVWCYSVQCIWINKSHLTTSTAITNHIDLKQSNS